MDYQLVFQFPVDEEFYFDAIIELETKLTFQLDGQYTFEKHEFTENEVNVYILTEHPDETIEKIISILSVKMLKTLKVGCRDITGNQFKCIYPPNFTGEFNIA